MNGAHQTFVLHARVVAGSGGGPDKTIVRSAAYGAEAGWPMAAAYVHPAGDDGIDAIGDLAKQHGCELLPVAERGPVDPTCLVRLARLCRRRRVGIWHSHDYKSNLLGLVLRKLWPMKLITTVHGWTGETRRMRLYDRLDKCCLPHYDQIIAVSSKLHDQCARLGVAAGRLTHVANGIDLGEYHRPGEVNVDHSRLSIEKDRFIIGTVGRFSREKGVDRAINLTGRLLKRYPNVRLHLIGDGPQRSALAALAQSLGIAHAVQFCGWQADPRPWYEAMDVLLLPSLTEGLPNVVLEAMAMGVPVAAANVGGVSDLLDGGRCGVILDDDVARWPDQVAPLIVSDLRRSELARRARKRVEAQYGFDQRMGKVFAVYQRAMGRGTLADSDGKRQAA